MKLEKNTSNTLDKVTVNIEKQCNKVDLSKIDSEIVKEAEEQVEESIQNTNNNLNESIQNNTDKVTEDMNKFTNNLADSDITPDKLQIEPNYTIILNIIMPGIAQILNGQTEKGMLLILGTPVVNVIIGLCSCGIGTIISYPLCIALICYDGYKCADKLKHKNSIKKFEFGF